MIRKDKLEIKSVAIIIDPNDINKIDAIASLKADIENISFPSEITIIISDISKMIGERSRIEKIDKNLLKYLISFSKENRQVNIVFQSSITSLGEVSYILGKWADVGLMNKINDEGSLLKFLTKRLVDMACLLTRKWDLVYMNSSNNFKAFVSKYIEEIPLSLKKQLEDLLQIVQTRSKLIEKRLSNSIGMIDITYSSKKISKTINSIPLDNNEISQLEIFRNVLISSSQRNNVIPVLSWEGRYGDYKKMLIDCVNKEVNQIKSFNKIVNNKTNYQEKERNDYSLFHFLSKIKRCINF